MPKFSWGDTVRAKASAGEARRPGELAEVVGIREIEDDIQARRFEAAIGTRVILIEFGDGVAIEVPESLLEPAEP